MYVRMYTKCATTRYVCKHFGNLVSSSRPCCYPQYTKKCLPAKVSECIRVCLHSVCVCEWGAQQRCYCCCCCWWWWYTFRYCHDVVGRTSGRLAISKQGRMGNLMKQQQRETRNRQCRSDEDDSATCFILIVINWEWIS